ncbi:MAG TPA: GDP-mannose 4,6-dehydratase [Pirellulales bacterium]|nr:GDP-mannose 4,6-dehydratase [Pirellulales bacterium]
MNIPVVLVYGQIRSILALGCGTLGLDYRVTQHAQFCRPGEIHVLQGDAGLAREKLGWQPTIRFRELVRMMVENDLAIARK